ncbi:mitochondrial large ribosomal subunit [Cryomyces antarcticus]|nr:hypothetical protein LTR04_005878 [Oleoguttula sp. CCFEE 6159]
MNSRAPITRLAQPTGPIKYFVTQSCSSPFSRSFTTSSTRSGFFDRFRRSSNDRENALNSPTSNPVLEEYLKKKPQGTPQLVRGDLASSSIFEEDRRKRGETNVNVPVPTENERKVPVRDPSAMHAALDPEPMNRKRWERKMLIREIRRGGKLSKTELIKRTERENLSKSHMFKTSIKKLGMLARQIAGKPVEEAIVQMRFSKKKVAREVQAHLEHARNEAIVKRGMGLGQAEGKKSEPIQIELKDGKRRTVEDPTGIYVDQAWVGRGEYGIAYDYRARGQVNTMRPPFTSISVLLKEEATRVRLSQERDKKRENRKLWVQLPDRPVTTQRQYYSW